MAEQKLEAPKSTNDIIKKIFSDTGPITDFLIDCRIFISLCYNSRQRPTDTMLSKIIDYFNQTQMDPCINYYEHYCQEYGIENPLEPKKFKDSIEKILKATIQNKSFNVCMVDYIKITFKNFNDGEIVAEGLEKIALYFSEKIGVEPKKILLDNITCLKEKISKELPNEDKSFFYISLFSAIVTLLSLLYFDNHYFDGPIFLGTFLSAKYITDKYFLGKIVQKATDFEKFIVIKKNDSEIKNSLIEKPSKEAELAIIYDYPYFIPTSSNLSQSTYKTAVSYFGTPDEKSGTSQCKTKTRHKVNIVDKTEQNLFFIETKSHPDPFKPSYVDFEKAMGYSALYDPNELEKSNIFKVRGKNLITHIHQDCLSELEKLEDKKVFKKFKKYIKDIGFCEAQGAQGIKQLKDKNINNNPVYEFKLKGEQGNYRILGCAEKVMGNDKKEYTMICFRVLVVNAHQGKNLDNGVKLLANILKEKPESASEETVCLHA